jgi:RNA polymerase sigma-70 factor, ECF subfamily
MKWSDAELIEEYKGGNLDAFHLFYERYKDILFTFLFNRCRDEANDLFQETFIKFIDAAKKKKIENPKSYLFQIAMNLVRNLGRNTKIISFSNEFEIPDENDEQDDLISEESLQESLEKLAKEKPLFYDVLHLHIFAKMTFEEIGKLKEKSKDTIASRYRYAIHFLRKILKDELDKTEEVNYA